MVVLADKGYIGTREHVRTPYRGRNKAASQKSRQPRPRPAESPASAPDAQLKTWHILRKLRSCPWQAGQSAKAIHVLQTHEIALRKRLKVLRTLSLANDHGNP
jgi:hypothetical protein